MKYHSSKLRLRLLCLLTGLLVLVSAALPAFAGGLVAGTEIRVYAVSGPFEIVSKTEDFVLAPGDDQELKAEASQPVKKWTWEVSKDGGKTWETIGSGPSYDIRNAQLNRDADGNDIPYKYRVTAENELGETASSEIDVLVTDDYGYRTVSKGSLSASGYFHKDTRLDVTPLGDGDSDAETALRDALRPGYKAGIFCDAELTNPNPGKPPYFGQVEMEFRVGNQYDGETIRILHYKDGKVEEITAAVKDGRVTIPVDAPGAFLAEVPAPALYTITASASNGGQISPEGAVQVPAEGELYFYFLPDPGYALEKIVVDGAELTLPGNVYHFTNVTADHTIYAVFKPLLLPPYTPPDDGADSSSSGGTNGGKPGTGDSSSSGGNPAGSNPASSNPASGSSAGSSSASSSSTGSNPAGGNPAGSNPAGSNPAGSNPAGSNPAGGSSASSSSAGSNPAGGNPAVGSSVTGDSGNPNRPGKPNRPASGEESSSRPNGANSSVTGGTTNRPGPSPETPAPSGSVSGPDSAASADSAASSQPEENFFTITVESDGHGSISPSGTLRVEKNGTQVFYLIPDDGYEIGTVTVNGEAVPVTNGRLALHGITGDLRIEAEFTPIVPADGDSSGWTCHCLWYHLFGVCYICRWFGRCIEPWCWLIPLIILIVILLLLFLSRKKDEDDAEEDPTETEDPPKTE